jgi:hypothetical protein
MFTLKRKVRQSMVEIVDSLDLFEGDYIVTGRTVISKTALVDVIMAIRTVDHIEMRKICKGPIGAGISIMASGTIQSRMSPAQWKVRPVMIKRSASGNGRKGYRGMTFGAIDPKPAAMDILVTVGTSCEFHVGKLLEFPSATCCHLMAFDAGHFEMSTVQFKISVRVIKT